MAGILILAAGGSSRLGQPKQLIPWQGRPLIRHAAEQALATGLGPVCVVMGAHGDHCQTALQGLDLHLCQNPDWQSGMGGSLAAGMRMFQPMPIEAVIITLCDQPFVTALTLLRLQQAALREGAAVMASHFEGVLGPPAYFTSAYFPQLEQLRGPAGARQIFQSGKASPFDCPEAGYDVDTPEDLARLQGAHQAAPRQSAARNLLSAEGP